MQRIANLEEARDLVRSAARLEEIAQGRYGVEFKPAGKNSLKAICPLHEETEPSFGVNTEKQLFHCFGCKEGGDVFSFVQKMENVTHIQAVELLADLFGVDLGPYKREETEADKKRRRYFTVNSKIHEWSLQYRDERFDSWVEDRRLDTDVLEKYDIGFSPNAPDVDARPDDLSALGADYDGKWEGRVVIPLKDTYGRITGFRLKSIDGSGPSMRGPRSDHPLDVPPVYGLREARKAIREAGHLILVEGEVDVWQMVAFGWENTAAALGSSLNKERVEYLLDHEVKRITILPDADAAGRQWAKTVAREIWPELHIKIASLDHGDPDEILLEDPALMEEALNNASHAVEYLIDEVVGGRRFDTMTQKMDAIADLREALKGIAGVHLDAAVTYISELVGIDEEFLGDYFREEVNQNVKLHNVMGERVILSKMLQDKEFVGDALLSLEAKDFYLSRHRTLFNIVRDLYAENHTVNYETVKTELINSGSKAMVPYLGTVLDTDVESADYLLDDIKDKSIRRRVRDRSRIVSQRLEDTSVDAQDVIQEFSADIASAVVGGGDAIRDIHSATDKRIRHMHRMAQDPDVIIGLDMGPAWRALNHTIHGLMRKRYVILAAPSGVGKTAIGGAWMRRFAVELSEPCLYMTFETGEETLTNRLLASISGVEQEKIITGHISGEEADLVQQAGEVLAASPIRITERGRAIEEAASIIRHDTLKRGTRVVFVDYLQLMHSQKNDNSSRYTELGDISRQLFELTRELDISLVAMAQLNRQGARKGFVSKEDIGDSYKIPQDSDIFYIVRMKTDDELRAEGPEKGDRYAVVDKHRHGREGVGCSIVADMATMRIKEYHSH